VTVEMHRFKNAYKALTEWLFRSRKTGRITIVQFPNAALGLFLAASVVQWLLGRAGPLSTEVRVLTAGSLIWWAVDELIRGVNPWRRLLGGAVLAGQILKYVA
jgi:hypothetical protein